MAKSLRDWARMLSLTTGTVRGIEYGTVFPNWIEIERLFEKVFVALRQVYIADFAKLKPIIYSYWHREAALRPIVNDPNMRQQLHLLQLARRLLLSTGVGYLDAADNAGSTVLLAHLHGEQPGKGVMMGALASSLLLYPREAVEAQTLSARVRGTGKLLPDASEHDVPDLPGILDVLLCSEVLELRVAEGGVVLTGQWNLKYERLGVRVDATGMDVEVISNERRNADN